MYVLRAQRANTCKRTQLAKLWLIDFVQKHKLHKLKSNQAKTRLWLGQARPELGQLHEKRKKKILLNEVGRVKSSRA
ncbi:hypothetical protein MTP99_018173 [Tenebrio molitor]|nr:hypothetical protein MTP99_018173 [Tenebrio molitor]